MPIGDLAPWNWGKREIPVRKEGPAEPFQALQVRMNQVLDEFFNDFNRAVGPASAGQPTAFSPRVLLEETDGGFTLKAELPGMTEKDIDLSLADNVLTLKGEKRTEKSVEKGGMLCCECSYGSFARQIPLPVTVEESETKACLNNGVLTVELVKVKDAPTQGTRICVN